MLSSNYFIICFMIVGCLFLYLLSSINDSEKEGFQQSQTIVFLGDSILKNNSYVSPGKSVGDLITQQINNTSSLYNYAEDDSMIHHVYQQLDLIPEYMNQPSTTVFLSVGGNDIIHDYIKQERDPKDTSLLKSKFKNYRTLVETIKEKMDQSKMVVLDLYYPRHPSFQNYIPLIREWNTLLYHESGEKVVPISDYVKDPNDFVYTIEPSETGAKKIVKALLTKLY